MVRIDVNGIRVKAELNLPMNSTPGRGPQSRNLGAIQPIAKEAKDLRVWGVK